MYKVFNKNCQDMQYIETNSIKLIFTSPPYWDLKNYGTLEQIGYKQSYQDYLNDMEIVWKECFRVLKKDGIICVNINSRTINGKYYPIHLDFQKQLSKIGFRSFDMAIWHKASGIPAQHNKLTDRFEYVIIAGKEDIRYCQNRILDYKNNDLEDINSWHIIKKAGNIISKNPHPAFYPTALVERGIDLFTQEGDTILDPFLGIGSSMVAAFNKKRNCYGFEVNSEYIKTFLKSAPKEMKIDVV